MTYLAAIAIAVANFPMVAVLFTMPYAAKQYRKYGACNIYRTFVVYSFILYCMCAYFLVILPLPSVEKVAAMTGPYYSVQPFKFVQDFIRQSGFAITKPSTYVPALKHATFLQPAFNAILLLPYGFYMRYYFKRNWKQTLLLTFCATLCFELTQLSALFGRYPRPYRLFDVDDLMLNTLGGMIGYRLVPLFHFLPDRDKIDDWSYQKGENVTIFRRFFAFGVDWIMIELISSILFITVNLLHLEFIQKSKLMTLMPWYLYTVLLYFIVVPIISKGETVGKRFVRIRLRTIDGETPVWWQYLLRNGILYYGIVPAPIWIFRIMSALGEAKGIVTGICFIVAVILTFFWLQFIKQCFKAVFHKKIAFMYERISKTTNVSTIQVEDRNLVQEKSEQG